MNTRFTTAPDGTRIAYDACGTGPAIEPGDFRCPMLWLVGSEDQHAVASVKEYQGSLKESRVQVHVVEGLDHEQVFDEIDGVFTTMLAFTRA